jgi:hypothetical protein
MKTQKESIIASIANILENVSILGSGNKTMEESKWSLELHVSRQRKKQYVKTITYHLPTKLLKLFLPSYSYLRYLYYMHKLLGP